MSKNFALRMHFLGEFTNVAGDDAEVDAHIATNQWLKAAAGPWQGMFYKDTTSGAYRIFNGTVWEYLCTGGGAGLIDSYREPGLICFIQPDKLEVHSMGFDSGTGTTGDNGIPAEVVCARQIDFAGGENLILKIENDDTPTLSDLEAVEMANAVLGNYHTHTVYWDYEPNNNILTPNSGDLGFDIMAKMVVVDALGLELDCLSVRVTTGAQE